MAEALDCRNRGVKHAMFTVLGCRATAVLVEGLFMDTQADYDKMVQAQYQKAYARAVVESIAEYLDLKKKPTEMYRVRKAWEDASSQKGAYSDLDNAILECKKHEDYKVFNSQGVVVYFNKSDFNPYHVKIVATVLNVREKADFDSKTVATVKNGEVYTIIEESNGLGKLKSGVGWISLNSKYVNKCE